MAGAYILIALGVAVWALAMPVVRRLPDGLMRGITVFGGAFLLGVCCLDLLPEASEYHLGRGESPLLVGLGRFDSIMPFIAILLGFLMQQMLDGLSAHAEHGHTEEGFTLAGLLAGLCMHAFLEGMPLGLGDEVDAGLLWGIVIHNIPVSLLLVGIMADRGYSMWRCALVLLLFGIMSPLGSLFANWLIGEGSRWVQVLTGMVVGVLPHVSSSILFDHKRNHFSWSNIGLMMAAFVLVAIVI